MLLYYRLSEQVLKKVLKLDMQQNLGYVYTTLEIKNTSFVVLPAVIVVRLRQG